MSLNMKHVFFFCGFKIPSLPKALTKGVAEKNAVQRMLGGIVVVSRNRPEPRRKKCVAISCVFFGIYVLKRMWLGFRLGTAKKKMFSLCYFKHFKQ